MNFRYNNLSLREKVKRKRLVNSMYVYWTLYQYD